MHVCSEQETTVTVHVHVHSQAERRLFFFLFSECAHRWTCRVLLWHTDVQLPQTQTLVGVWSEPAGILPLASDFS